MKISSYTLSLSPMKKSASFLFVLVFTALSFPARALENTTGDTLLNGIQAKIEMAFRASFATRKTDRMSLLDRQLEQFPATDKLRDYWLAYSAYYQAIFYLQRGEKEKAQQKIQASIDRLGAPAQPTSESYALLALVESFSIQFASGMQAGVLSAKVRRHAQKACELDPANLRAWYVRASNDYYTPKSLGGGQQTEAFLLKAIALDEQPRPDARLPRWGKADAYALLISFYLDKNDQEKARRYSEQGLALYPDDYKLNQAAAKVEPRHP